MHPVHLRKFFTEADIEMQSSQTEVLLEECPSETEKKISRQQRLKSVAKVKEVMEVLLLIRQRYIDNNYLVPFGEDLGPGEGSSDWDEGYPDPSYNEVIKLLGNRLACAPDANDSVADKRLKEAVLAYGMVVQQSFDRLSTEIPLAVLVGGVVSGAIPNPVKVEHHACNRINLGAVLTIHWAAVKDLDAGEEKNQKKKEYLNFVKQLKLHGKTNPDTVTKLHQKGEVRNALGLYRVFQKLPIIYSMVGGNMKRTARLSNDAVDAFLKYIADITIAGSLLDYGPFTLADYYTGNMPPRHMQYAEGGVFSDAPGENDIEDIENELFEELNERVVELEAEEAAAVAAAAEAAAAEVAASGAAAEAVRVSAAMEVALAAAVAEAAAAEEARVAADAAEAEAAEAEAETVVVEGPTSGEIWEAYILVSNNLFEPTELQALVESTGTEMKRLFRQLSLRAHPDKNNGGTPASNALFRAIRLIQERLVA